MLIVLTTMSVCEKKEERSVILLYRQKLWMVLKVTKVYVLSLRTVLFRTVCVCEQTEMFKESQREGYCYRNCAGFKCSPRVSLCGTAFLNGGCRGLGAIR
jgi:hypothetical protein